MRAIFCVWSNIEKSIQIKYIRMHFDRKRYLLLKGQIAISSQIILLVGGGEQKSNNYIRGGGVLYLTTLTLTVKLSSEIFYL